MKAILKSITFLLLVSTITFTSCRTEEIESIQAPEEETLVPNSAVATLMQRTATNDGSDDNIIDLANCFDVQLPVTVIANGIELTINSNDDIQLIEDIYDEFEDDVNELEIIFPITIILSDFTEVVVNNLSELNGYSSACNGENENDDDIECIDFLYPFSASVFNANNELIDVITINSDDELFDFIDDIDEDDIISIQFPITVILFDGSTITINNLNELETTINNFEDACDEDDDFDWNDDDCDNCTDTQLTDILTDCSDWMVDKLERNNNDLEDYYVGYIFNFFSNGSLTVDYNSTTYPGTWSASGTGNNIIVTIDISGLPDCNNNWILHEIDQNGESKVDLRLGDDRLRFESDCISDGGPDDTALVQALTTGDWYVTYFFDDIEETSDFSDYVFNYASDGTATATDSNGSTNGTWSTSLGDETELELNLNFGVTVPLYDLTEDWDVLEVTNDIIRLKDVSGGDGSEDFLTFERTPTGSGGDDLTTILTDGLWFVASYLEDTDDQTANYNGYELNFDITGTVVADNGSNPNNGTYAVLSGGNQMALDFGTAMPFSEFNDTDWDVLSVSATEVIIQDVSGGNGGTDTLTLQKL